MNPVTLPTFEEMTPDVKLSEDQLKAVEEEKSLDWDAPKKDDKAEPEKAKPEEPEVKEEPKEEKEEKEEKETPEPEDEQAKAAEKAEQERLEKKAKEIGKIVEEVKKMEAEEKAEQERLEKIAKDEGMTIDEVKEMEAKDKSIAERHGNDPIKVARALRKEQSEYGKLKNEIEQLREFKTKTEAQQAKFNEDHFNMVMEQNRDKLIDQFREKSPVEAESLSDDACFERAKTRIKEALKAQEEHKLKEFGKEAETKRGEMIKTLPKEYNDYVPEIKELLNECDDVQILDKGFDVTFLANYVRGKKFTPDYIKSLEDSAYKRGIEQPKIIPPVHTSKPTKETKSTKLIDSLTDVDKRRAEEIYGRREGWSRERMWETYAKDDKGKDF